MPRTEYMAEIQLAQSLWTKGEWVLAELVEQALAASPRAAKFEEGVGRRIIQQSLARSFARDAPSDGARGVMEVLGRKVLRRTIRFEGFEGG